MKIKSLFYFSLCIVLLFTFSCKLDNYAPPSASVFGKIVDSTGTAIQSDISGSGVKITYIEMGDFASPTKQSMGLKGDGTYRNDMMFPGIYNFFIQDANFMNIDTVKNFIVKKGDNEINYIVQPYIKVNVTSIVQVGTMVVATFTMKTLRNNLINVDQVQLFSHIDPVVSFGSKIVNSTALSLKRVVGAAEVFTLQIDLSQQSNNFTKYPTETKFWFRVGALVVKTDASVGSTPKWNYSAPIQLSLTL
jgi:spore maturation protein CgeB